MFESTKEKGRHKNTSTIVTATTELRKDTVETVAGAFSNRSLFSNTTAPDTANQPQEIAKHLPSSGSPQTHVISDKSPEKKNAPLQGVHKSETMTTDKTPHYTKLVQAMTLINVAYYAYCMLSVTAAVSDTDALITIKLVTWCIISSRYVVMLSAASVSSRSSNDFRRFGNNLLGALACFRVISLVMLAITTLFSFHYFTTTTTAFSSSFPSTTLLFELFITSIYILLEQNLKQSMQPTPESSTHQPRAPTTLTDDDDATSQQQQQATTEDNQEEARLAEKNQLLSIVSQEIRDTCSMIMATLEQFSPSPLLVPSAHELLSACSMAVPVSSISAITTTVKHARHIGSNLHLLDKILQNDDDLTTAPQRTSANHCRDFDMGELIQHIGDALAGLSAKLGVHIVIYHMDSGFYFPSVFADEAALKHTLLTLLRNILECSTPGACIEFGLMMQPSPDESNKVRVTYHIVQTASPAIPVGLTKAMISNIGYTEKLVNYIDGHLETESMEKNKFKIEISLDVEPSSSNSSSSHSNTGNHDLHLSKSQSHPSHMFFDTPSRFFETQFANMRFANEPTLEELSVFLTQLKGVKLILHAPEKSNFAKHLTSCLTSWNTDISHLPVLTYATSSHDDADSSAASLPNQAVDGALGISGSESDTAASMFNSQHPSGLKTPLENVLSQSTAATATTTDLSPSSNRSLNSNNTTATNSHQKIPSPAIEEDHIHSIPPAFILIDDDILTLERKLRGFRDSAIHHHQQQQLQRQSSANTSTSSGSGMTNESMNSNPRNNSNSNNRAAHHHPSIHHSHHSGPHHHRRNKSRTTDTSSGQGTLAIIFFTSLSNYKRVRETIQWYTSASTAVQQPMPTAPLTSTGFTQPTATANTTAVSPSATAPSYYSSHHYLPRVVVVPKPAGPRRFLTALHTAWHNAVVEPNFVPIATSPMSPMLMNLLPTTSAATVTEQQHQQQQQHHLVSSPMMLTNTATPHHSNPYVQHPHYPHDTRYSPRRMHSPHQLEGTEKGNYFFVDPHRPMNTSPSLLSAAGAAAPLAVNSPKLSMPPPAPSITAVAPSSCPSPPSPSQQVVTTSTTVPATIGTVHNTATTPGTPTEVKRRLRSKSSLRRAFMNSGGVGPQPAAEGLKVGQGQPLETKETVLSPTQKEKASSPIKTTNNNLTENKLPTTTVTSPTLSSKKIKKNKKMMEMINSPMTAANTALNAATTTITTTASPTDINPSTTITTSPNTTTTTTTIMPNTNIPSTLNPATPGTPAPVDTTIDTSTGAPATTTTTANTTPSPSSVPAASTNSNNKPKSKFNFKISNRKRKEKVNSSGKQGPPITVLIVEDNMINQAILSTWMKKHSIKFSVASDGKEAVEKWKGGGFHLILMDIQLPVMDGIEATKLIRAIEKERKIGVLPSSSSSTSTLSSQDDDHHNVRNKTLAEQQQETKEDTDNKDNKTKGEELQGGGGGGGGFQSPVIIVALTASSLESDRQAALAAGCNDFLTKPVSLEWLEKKIMEWGCMQALIDFEGWRKWKRSSPSTNITTTAATANASAASKTQKHQQPYLTFNNQRQPPSMPNNNNSSNKEEIEREKELLALRTKELLQDETKAIVLTGVHKRRVSSNITTPTAVQHHHQRTQSSSSSSANDPRVLQQQLSRYMNNDKLPLPKVPSDPDLYQQHHPFEYMSIPQQVEERARRRALELQQQQQHMVGDLLINYMGSHHVADNDNGRNENHGQSPPLPPPPPAQALTSST